MSMLILLVNWMKRPKVKCEVCGEKKNLERHHIIPRCDSRSTNKDSNLAILCPNCHASVHSGDIILLGIYDSTGGKKLLWHYLGEEPGLEKEFWVVKYNPKVKMKE